MYLHRIKLRNIRGFDDLEFHLDRPDGSYAGWTVFTGDNGSGKSTFLKSIAICLAGKDVARSLQPSFHRWIRHGSAKDDSLIEIEVVGVESDDGLSEKGRAPGRRFGARLDLQNGGRETTLIVGTPDSAANKSSYKTPERTIWSTSASGWLSCGYGPFRRVFGASPDAMQQMVSPSTTRFATMFQEAASLAEADRWLRDLNYKRLENHHEEEQQLAALTELLNDDLMPNQLKVDRVDSDGLWLRDRNGVQLAWHEMSDGYRAALALLVDIFRHFSTGYGANGLTGRDESGKLVVKRSGVVLIDEVDAHLHPEWQREIGFWLKSRFPKVQFLVTSHSPIICQAADPHGLFVLPEPGSAARPFRVVDDEYQRIIASRPDTILLSSAFKLENTRSPLAVENRREFARLESMRRSGVLLSIKEEQRRQQLFPWINEDEE